MIKKLILLLHVLVLCALFVSCKGNRVTNSPPLPSPVLSPPISTGTQASTPLPLSTHTPIVSPQPTEQNEDCSPSPLGNQLPPPTDPEGYVGLYYTHPNEMIEGAESYVYVPHDGYAISYIRINGVQMLWLEKDICAVEENETSRQSFYYFKVVDVVELPTAGPPDYDVSLNICMINNFLQPNVVGYGKVPDYPSGPSDPILAWRIDYSKERIIPRDVGNLKCQFPIRYE